MKIRNKMMLIILPIMAACIILLNVAFGLFYQYTILSEEDRQIKLIEKNLTSYVSDNQREYIGRVNDWSHWDETFYFLENLNPEFIENIVDQTFIDLDVNFIIFIDENDRVLEKFFYDFRKEDFSDFPAFFFRDIETLLTLPGSAGDASGVIRLGQEYYFVASSETTNSFTTDNPNGKMLIGRQIDRAVMNSIENSLGCRVISISTTDTPTSRLINLQERSYSENKDSVILSFSVSNSIDQESAVLFTLKKTRDMYVNGRKNVFWFGVSNTVLFLLITVFIFVLMNKYLSKPFIRLFNDITTIDLNGAEFRKMPEEGKYEFLTLRQTVNKMLDRINAEQSNVRDREEKLLAILLSVGDGVITTETDNRIRFMNPVAEKLTGWTNPEARDKDIYAILNLKDKNMQDEIEHCARTSHDKNEICHLSFQTVIRSRREAEKYIDLSIAPIKDKTSVAGYVFVFRDYSDRREKQERIQYLSYHDQLTDLFNRRYFEENLNRIDVAGNLPLSILYADINGLKFINDAFGHQSGDQMIMGFAKVLKETCGEGILARLGGDEFIVLLSNFDFRSMEKLAGSIREKVDQIKVNNLDLSVSMGWDTKHNENESIFAIIKRAEDIMYKKKLLSINSRSNAVIQTILNTLLIKNPREKGHSQRVGMFCKAIGQAFGLPKDQINELETAGELHDIGKIILDESILNKAGALTEPERAEVRKHPEIGYRLLGNANEFYKISEFVLDHHERWDGTGYPNGLKGEEIHWEARVITLADAYDAMTSERTYKRAFSEKEAIEEIERNSGIQFDPVIARVFVEEVLGYKRQ